MPDATPKSLSELARFQVAFTEAIAGTAEPIEPWTRGREAERRLSVYRNTIAKGCADALAAQFPSVLRVVGEDWMRDAAVRFAAVHPPTRASLADYGEAFPAWLSAFAPAAEMPYLASLARIDWARHDALFAPDHPSLPAADFTMFEPDDYARVCAQLHPSAQVLWFEDGAPRLWVALQGEAAPDAAVLSAEPQGLLLVRPEFAVAHRVLGPGEYLLLDACRRGLSLAAAGEAALQAQPELALADSFAELISMGTFGGVTGSRTSDV